MAKILQKTAIAARAVIARLVATVIDDTRAGRILQHDRTRSRVP
jgi:hypothetical protein